ncbi:MFS transporter [Thermotalea metallivorans]|uniref:Putative bacilysin exporter BacE n=1 Tax=Thermotalea metallivorans TaxID=520762 RepID=A0A140L1U0_9FIRM|nr:MFS transporter [Thermotalea metallivorans]KXG74515.1 putative bacilysin exporter BacE [Thermotalea metallivorans]
MQYNVDAIKTMIKARKEFVLVGCAQVISDLGNWFYTVAVSAMIYSMSRSATALSMVLILSLIPSAIFSIIGGAISDKYNAKKTMIYADLIRGIITLFALRVIATGSVNILYIIAFINSICGAIFTTARYRIITHLVPKEQLSRAFSRLRILYELTVILGSATGGLVFAFLGFQYVIFFNSFTFFLSLILLLFVFYEEEEIKSSKMDNNFVAMQKEGFKYITQNKKLRILSLYKIFYTISGGILNILPSILAIKIFNYGETGIGFTFSAIGIGSIIGAYFVGKLKTETFEKANLVYGGVVIIFGWLTLLLVKDFYFALLAIAIICTGNIFSHTYIESFSVKDIEQEFVGRISGVFQSITYGAVFISLTLLARWIDIDYQNTISFCIVLVIIPNLITYMMGMVKTPSTDAMNDKQG